MLFYVNTVHEFYLCSDCIPSGSLHHCQLSLGELSASRSNADTKVHLHYLLKCCLLSLSTQFGRVCQCEKVVLEVVLNGIILKNIPHQKEGNLIIKFIKLITKLYKKYEEKSNMPGLISLLLREDCRQKNNVNRRLLTL